MNEIADILFERLEASFRFYRRAKNRIKFFAEFELSLILMIFPRPQLRQLRCQRQDVPAVLQRRFHRLAFGDILVDPVAFFHLAVVIFFESDPDDNVANFAITPDDAMVKDIEATFLCTYQDFVYFRLDQCDMLRVDKSPDIFLRSHKCAFGLCIRGIKGVERVIEFKQVGLLVILPGSQVGKLRRERKQLLTIVGY